MAFPTLKDSGVSHSDAALSQHNCCYGPINYFGELAAILKLLTRVSFHEASASPK